MLTDVMPSNSAASEEEDIVGVWAGEANSEALPEPIQSTLDLWLEGDKLIGVQASVYFVQYVERLRFTDNNLNYTMDTILGKGTFSGKISGNSYDQTWIVGENQGKADMKKVDPASTPAVDSSILNGTFAGPVTSPIFQEDLAVSITLKADGDKLSGTVSWASAGEAARDIKITKGTRRHNRIILEFTAGDEDDQGMIVATVNAEGELEAFLHIGIEAGEGKLKKK